MPMISDKTWGKILDYSEPHSALNNFSESIINDAKRQAAGVARTAAEEAGLGLAVRLPTSPETTQAKDVWFKSNLIKYVGISGALIGIGAAAAYKFREPLKKGTAEVVKKGKEAVQGLASRMRAFNIREHINRISKGAKERLKKATEQETKSPEEVEKEKEKIAADPLIKFYKEECGFDLRPGDLTYKVPAPEDIGQEQARILTLNNYSDLRMYWDGLSKQQQKKTLNYGGLGVFGPKGLWKHIEKTPNLIKESNVMQEKALRGMLADEYKGLPAKEEISEEKVKEVKYDIEKKFGIKVGRALRGYTEGYVDAEEELEGLKKFAEALKELPPEMLKELRERFIYIGMRGADYARGGARIEIDSSLSPMEIRESLIRDIEKTKENLNLRKMIHKRFGFSIGSPYYDYNPKSPEEDLAVLKKLYEVLASIPQGTLPQESTLYFAVERKEIHKYKEGNLLIPIDPSMPLDQLREFLIKAPSQAKE